MSVTQPTAYDSGFFDMHRQGARRSAEVIVPLLLELMPCTSVADVGCGTGTWLAVFAEHGVSTLLGIDGDHVDRTRLEIRADEFRALDLEHPFRLERRFDLAMSLEVAEHLSPSAAADFVGSLTALAPVVLFSAAIPFQSGRHHVNEQWPDYWASLFDARRFAAIDCLRLKLWADERVEWWYAQNMVVYADREALPTLPALQSQCGIAPSPPLAMVHPRRYLEWVEWWMAKCGTD